MKTRGILTTAAIATAVVFTLATTTAQADDCDDIMDALKKLGERVMNYKDDAKTPLRGGRPGAGHSEGESRNRRRML